jgi:hypothetical protein
MASISVRPPRTPREREAVFSFRYTVYVEEMRRDEPHADHRRRRIIDPLDATGYLLAAFGSDGRVVGTVRVNLSRDSNLSSYEGPYGMTQAPFVAYHPHATGIVTKLMVSDAYRRSTVAVRLARACYDYGRRQGVAFSFIDCNPHLKPFFERLGFRQVMPDFTHPVYGRVHPLVLDVRDAAILQQGAVVLPSMIPGVSPGLSQRMIP